jgi:hypothetical protein
LVAISSTVTEQTDRDVLDRGDHHVVAPGAQLRRERATRERATGGARRRFLDSSSRARDPLR